MKEHQAASLEKQGVGLASGNTARHTKPIRILVTGSGPPEKIECVTIRLGLHLANGGYQVLSCHLSQPQFGQSEEWNPAIPPLPSPVVNYCTELGQSQAAALSRATDLPSCVEESSEGTGHKNKLQSPKLERPRVSRIVSRFVQSVCPLHALPYEHAYPKGQQYDWVLVAGDRRWPLWNISWWKKSHFVLLVTGVSRNDLIDCYAQVKRLREYPPGIALAVECESKRHAHKAFRLLSGALKEFLGISPWFVGTIPPGVGSVRTRSTTGDLFANESKELDQSIAHVGRRLIWVARRLGYVSAIPLWTASIL